MSPIDALFDWLNTKSVRFQRLFVLAVVTFCYAVVILFFISLS